MNKGWIALLVTFLLGVFTGPRVRTIAAGIKGRVS